MTFRPPSWWGAQDRSNEATEVGKRLDVACKRLIVRPTSSCFCEPGKHLKDGPQRLALGPPGYSGSFHETAPFAGLAMDSAPFSGKSAKALSLRGSPASLAETTSERVSG